ncbi:hypothetical protein [Actinomyces trachealis]|uniref:hypothetical protein n=1 Tax=Actinomyces trachealis TaxID=2763540 RepID=UPI0018C4A09A|nr:hypothetical protein [Actinomyces trachealis]
MSEGPREHGPVRYGLVAAHRDAAASAPGVVGGAGEPAGDLGVEQVELISAPPPADIGRMSRLVAYRIQASCAPELAPSRLPHTADAMAARARRQAEDARQERSRRVSEELGRPARQDDGVDQAAWAQALASARAAMPDATRIEVNVEALRLFKSSAGGEAA